MFVYPDRDAFREGLSSKNPTGFIHVQMGPESLTMAVSHGATEGLKVSREVITVLQGLRDGSF